MTEQVPIPAKKAASVAKPTRVRVTVDFSPKAYQLLCKLEELTQAESKAEVLRKALSTYEIIAMSALEGYKVVLDNGSDRPEVLRLL